MGSISKNSLLITTDIISALHLQLMSAGQGTPCEAQIFVKALILTLKVLWLHVPALLVFLYHLFRYNALPLRLSL